MNKNVLIIDDSLYSTQSSGICSDKRGIRSWVKQRMANRLCMAITLRPDIITLDNILPDMIGTDTTTPAFEGDHHSQ